MPVKVSMTQEEIDLVRGLLGHVINDKVAYGLAEKLEPFVDDNEVLDDIVYVSQDRDSEIVPNLGLMVRR